MTREVRAACPEAAPDALLEHAERAVLQGRLEDYPRLQDDLDAALACGAPATPRLVARALQLQGVYHHAQGEIEGAELSFRTAAALAPGLWNEAYGEALRVVFERARNAPPQAPGELSLDPALPASFRAVVDGRAVSLPVAVPVGFHLLQVVGEDGVAVHASRLLVLDPGERVVRTTGPLRSTTPAPAPSGRRPAWPLVAAGGAALLGTGAAVLAVRQDAQLRGASSLDALDAAYARQQALSATAWTLGGVAVAGAGVWFAF